MFQIVKDAVDLKDVISEVEIEVNRHGKALCPFHLDRRPSLSIKGNRWRCFACGESGDAFDFYEKYFRMNKREALGALAQRAGIPLEHRNSPEVKRKIEEARKKQERRKRFDAWLNEEIHLTALILRHLDEEVDKITPENFNTAEAEFVLKKRDFQGYLFEILLHGTLEEKVLLFREK